MMNESVDDSMIQFLHKKILVNRWKQSKWKEKPLIIYGKKGQGKSTLGKYILKDYTCITINSDFIKHKQTLRDYLDLSLYKKSISMMFSNKPTNKAIIFDDLQMIQETDKPLFKSIVEFSKKKITEHPIIYICSTINNKQFQSIYKKCYPIEISYNLQQMNNLSRRIFTETKLLTNTQIDECIKKSYYNFHNISNNLKFYKDNFQTISTNDTKEESDQLLLDKLLIIDRNEIYRECSSNVNIISLNVLENYTKQIHSLKKISEKQKIKLIQRIYHNHCLGDSFLTSIHQNNEWEMLDYIINFSIVVPIIYTKPYLHTKKPSIKIKYTSYISKCIHYIYNKKIYREFSVENHQLEELYFIFFKYVTSTEDTSKHMYREKIRSNKVRHLIPPKVFDGFCKIFGEYYNVLFSNKTFQII